MTRVILFSDKLFKLLGINTSGKKILVNMDYNLWPITKELRCKIERHRYVIHSSFYVVENDRY